MRADSQTYDPQVTWLTTQLEPLSAELRRLDTIPASFKLAPADARLLNEAVQTVITPTNPCLQQIHALVLANGAAPGAVPDARKVCRETEGPRAE